MILDKENLRTFSKLNKLKLGGFRRHFNVSCHFLVVHVPVTYIYVYVYKTLPDQRHLPSLVAIATRLRLLTRVSSLDSRRLPSRGLRLPVAGHSVDCSLFHRLCLIIPSLTVAPCVLNPRSTFGKSLVS